MLFDAASRGRYATDASIYQIVPTGVFVPKTDADVAAAFELAREAGVSILARGAGTSQCGQTTGPGLVVDCTKHLRRIVAVDVEARTATVEPGVVPRRAQRAAEAARPVVPGRRLDERAGDDRRHGRQQLVRLALHPLRQHGAQRPRHRAPAWPTAAEASVRACWPSATGRAAAGRQPSFACPGRAGIATEIVARIGRRCCAGSAATTSTSSIRKARGLIPPTAASTSLTCSSAPRARSRGRASSRSSSALLPRAQGCSASSTSPTFRAAMAAAQHIVGLEPKRSRAGRPDDDRAGARQSRVPARRCDTALIGRIRRRSCWSSSPARTEGARCSARLGRPRRADGRPRPARQRRRDEPTTAAEGPVGSAQGRPQHHDEPEGRRQTGELHRGLRSAARTSGRIHRRA